MLDDEDLSAPVTSGGPRVRRRWPLAEKRRIVHESLEAGASVSVVARRHDVNANQVFAWQKLYWDGLLGGGGLVPVAVLADGPVASALSRVLIVLAARRPARGPLPWTTWTSSTNKSGPL